MNKKIIHILTILILGQGVSFSQTGVNGIFKSSNDFVNGKITHAGKHTQLKTHALFEQERLEVKSNDSIYSYLKKDVFGYVDKEGFTYRFLNNSIYPILNPYERILLYKQTSGTGMKNSPVTETYFFSKDAASAIQLLTLENLEHAFSSDKPFLNILEIHFKKNDDLIDYDSVHKMYKLNRLLQISHEEKHN